MRKDDEKFLKQTTDPQARAEAICRWRRSRLLSFIAFLIIFSAALVVLDGDRPAACGLFSGVGALLFAVMVSTDMKIKVALLVDELGKQRPEI
ncbi:MAG: hypothetical protein HN742_01155 [Lentisphaerae bacterium]|jgi:hypothetical protein|nr:hypothetical protein [Lentisphaerota bacterium]MBT5605952.1 hypothetical protein [Lentisphaerota bacterium]MBT7058830.1 hypothetical protein [Lentisphaerota bacterium]MBT7840441.1 hypothetical protein [Lentisphaerota bacterium]